MKGKTLILIVLISTLIGIALAWFFLQVLPTNLEEQAIILNTRLPNLLPLVNEYS